jgi:hypothetical protein
MLPNKKVKEIHKSFSTLNTLADVSHVYAYFILSCGCGKRQEIINLMNIETVIDQRFLCGVNREIVAWNLFMNVTFSCRIIIPSVCRVLRVMVCGILKEFNG